MYVVTYYPRIQVMNTNTTDTYPNLLAWRTDLRLKQVDAAKLLGMSRARYSQLERGLPTSGKRAKQITQVTRVPIEVLVGAL